MTLQETMLTPPKKVEREPPGVAKTDGIKCDECGNALHPLDAGYTCLECGLVHESNFVDSSYNDLGSGSYRNKGTQSTSKASKIGDVTGDGSFIGGCNQPLHADGKGRPLDYRIKARFEHLKDVEFKRGKKFNETTRRVLNVLKKITNYLEMNDNVRHRAAYLYKKLLREIPDGLEDVPRNNITLICVCLFWATRDYPAYSFYTYKRLASIFQLHGHRVKVNGIQSVGALLVNVVGVKLKPRMWHQFIVPIIQNLENDNELIENLNEIKGTYFDFTKKLITLALILKDGLPEHPSKPLILACACVYGAGIMHSRINGTSLVVTSDMIARSFKFDVPAKDIRDRYETSIKDFLDTLVS